MEIRKIEFDGKQLNEKGVGLVKQKISSALKKLGYDFQIYDTSKVGFNVRDIRLSDAYVKKYGYNFSPYTGHRGRVLGWQNWVEVNNTVNDVLDKMHLGANVSSLHKTFKIREGKHKFTESDWEEHAYENVGSMVAPVTRKEAWQPEHELERWKAKKLAEVL